MTDLLAQHQSTNNLILRNAAHLRQADLCRALWPSLQGTVQSGPFAGMRLLPESSWGGGARLPQLLGCFEQQLHAALAALTQAPPSLVVNIGCADGYYAVGLGRLLPEARILASDCSDAALAQCRKAAELNGIAERLTVTGAFSPETLQDALRDSQPALLVVDCEGCEETLLDPVPVPALSTCSFIVECHDFKQRGLTEKLMARFEASHTLQRVIEGARNPNDFPFLQRLSGLDRWLAVTEFRPETMSWLVAQPLPPQPLSF